MDTLKARQIARELYSRMMIPSDAPVMHPAGDGKLFIIPLTPAQALGYGVLFYQIEPFYGSIRALEEVKEKELREISFYIGVQKVVRVINNFDEKQEEFLRETRYKVIPSFYVTKNEKKEVALFFGLVDEKGNFQYITESNLISMLDSIPVNSEGINGFIGLLDEKTQEVGWASTLIAKTKYSSFEDFYTGIMREIKSTREEYPDLFKVVEEIAEEYKEK